MTECIQESLNRSRLRPIFRVVWKPGSRRVESLQTGEHYCCAKQIARSGCWDVWATVLWMAARRFWSGTSSRRCFRSAFYGLAPGYEDLNDHEKLRSDPLLGVLSGKRKLEEPLAGKSTLNRLELVGRTGFLVTSTSSGYPETPAGTPQKSQNQSV
jgi:hypothetical protein